MSSMCEDEYIDPCSERYLPSGCNPDVKMPDMDTVDPHGTRLTRRWDNYAVDGVLECCCHFIRGDIVDRSGIYSYTDAA